MKATDIALARAAAHANGADKEPPEIRYMPLSDKWGLAGLEILPVKSDDGTKIAAMLMGVGIRLSRIAGGIEVKKIAIAPLAEVSIENLIRAFEGEKPPEPTPGTQS